MTISQWLLFIAIVQLIHFFGTWKLYQKAGFKSWQAAIPVYNAIVLMQIINRPKWWVVMLFIPIINLIIFPVVWVEIARSFGKNSTTDTLLTLLSFGLYIYVINYRDQSDYIENRSLQPRTAFGEWFSSILFAVVIATLVHTYFIQPYIIPTGSLEKTLLTGDFLFVSKYHYGARVPQTAVSFPMVHDTIPVAKIRSYLKNPEIPYMRLPRLQKIKRNEIVVFSWPADTVRQFFKKEARVDKPIDKKSNYVKRCVAIPGDTLEIIDGIIHINGEQTVLPDRAKPLYGYTAYSKTGISARELIKQGIKDLNRRFRIENDITQQQLNALFANNINVIRQGDMLIAITGSRGIPRSLIRKERLRVTELRETKKTVFLTIDEANSLTNNISLDSLVRNINQTKTNNTNFFPNDIRYNWNEDNFGPIVMPKQGITVVITRENIALYKKLIRDYENKSLEEINGTYYIDGKATDTYTFEKDYFWMMGDNRHRSEDSRFWGFVPDNHIVGKPIFIWMSIDGINDGISNWKVRWDRVFTTTNGDGEPVSYRWHFLAGLIVYQLVVRIRKRRKK
ncbi:MAG: signal peptidase I [Flavobacteriaceae bacterium]|nr:signal peptidase I [Flavobacteriaceae bacterium]